MAKTKILITGSKGMLGSAVLEEFAPLETIDKRARDVMSLTGFTSDYQIKAPDENSCDITDLEAVKKNLLDFHPDVVIHSAAYTDVDGCQLYSDLAYRVNALGTKNVALATQEVNAILVHISTDYIFDGQKESAYTEDDSPNPLNIYGQTKLEAERLIKSILNKFIIVRTSWLFGENGKNFVDAILEKAKTKNKLEVVNDQIGSPTYTRDLAGAIKLLIEVVAKRNQNSLFGIYNITNSQSCSWYEFAKTILEYKNLKDVEVVPITSHQLHRPAKRPQNSRLDNAKFFKLTASSLRPWPQALRDYLKTTH